MWGRWTRSGLSNISYPVSYIRDWRDRTKFDRDEQTNHPRRGAYAVTRVILEALLVGAAGAPIASADMA